MYFHHSMTYPDGTRIEGKLNHQLNLDYLGIKPDFVAGKAVLDIATNDGFFAFWSEWNGAKNVVATDVDSYDRYDWGPRGAPEGIEKLMQQDKAEAFWHHHKKTNSKVEKEEISIYDMGSWPKSQFGVIFNFGLLYHLRHPRLALEICAGLCANDGALVLETHTNKHVRNFAAFTVDAGEYTGVLSKTDACAPSVGAIIHWLHFAGFEVIYFKRRITDRMLFIAAKNEGVIDQWSRHGKFMLADYEIMDRIKTDTRLLFGGYLWR